MCREGCRDALIQLIDGKGFEQQVHLIAHIPHKPMPGRACRKDGGDMKICPDFIRELNTIDLAGHHNIRQHQRNRVGLRKKLKRFFSVWRSHGPIAEIFNHIGHGSQHGGIVINNQQERWLTIFTERRNLRVRIFQHS